MHPVSTEVLKAEIERLEAIAFVCENPPAGHAGEVEGGNAARSQLRALKLELESREQAED